jgi:hypothetical protein
MNGDHEISNREILVQIKTTIDLELPNLHKAIKDLDDRVTLRMDKVEENCGECKGEVDKRINALEQWSNTMKGSLIIIGAGITYLLTIVKDSFIRRIFP